MNAEGNYDAHPGADHERERERERATECVDVYVGGVKHPVQAEERMRWCLIFSPCQSLQR